MEFDARAKLEAWEHARRILASWVEATRHIGSDELTGVMQEALGRVDENLARARRGSERQRPRCSGP